MHEPLTVAAALDLVLAQAAPLPPEETPLYAAAGRVLARDVRAVRDLPAFDNSQMDGYALHLQHDVLATNGQPLEFRIVGSLPAGSSGSYELTGLETVRVFTGGPLPANANAVVMQEQMERVAPTHVRLQASVERGQFIRRAGSDVRAGEVALHAGDVLTPAAIGLLASLGATAAPVHRTPWVAILSTGDELVPLGHEPGPNQTIEGNSLMLAAALGALGIEQVRIGREPDDPAAIRHALGALLEGTDVLLITGGVSVGEHDHVKGLLEELGVEQVFWRVRQRPGKPLYCGRRGATIVLGLPGNPASTLFTFYHYVWPLLRTMQGFVGTAAHLRRRRAWLETPARGIGGLTQFLRGQLWESPEGEGWVRALGGQGSHQMRPFALANCLIVLPERDGMYGAGEGVECLVLP